MLLRMRILGINLGFWGLWAQESWSEERKWSLVLGLTLSYPQLQGRNVDGA